VNNRAQVHGTCIRIGFARSANRCLRARVPFFFKQWGGVIKSRTGRLLDGRTWDEMPPHSANFCKLVVQAEGGHSRKRSGVGVPLRQKTAIAEQR
jgi:Protein of unknown function (DUF5131)